MSVWLIIGIVYVGLILLGLTILAILDMIAYRKEWYKKYNKMWYSDSCSRTENIVAGIIFYLTPYLFFVICYVTLRDGCGAIIKRLR